VRLLVLGDEPLAAHALAKRLCEQEHTVDIASGADDALVQAAIADHDAIVLDVTRSLRDGLATCRDLRRNGLDHPMLMLTAQAAVQARIAALDSGADDYLVKPFDFGELLARLRALIRRHGQPARAKCVVVGALRLDRRARRAFRDEQPLTLTAREYALLEYLVLHAGEVVSRTCIAEQVWHSSTEALSNVIDVHIQRLRRKIDRPGASSSIVTRRGEGYMLVGVISPRANA